MLALGETTRKSLKLIDNCNIYRSYTTYFDIVYYSNYISWV